jgi:REP element-mobilizing transposase RayT
MSRPLSQTSLHTALPIGSDSRSKLRSQLLPPKSHGGAPSVGKRKTTRPWNPAAPVHLVLQSQRARGAWSLLHRKNRNRVQAMIYRYAERFQVRVYRATNTGTGIQLLVKAHDRKALADFLRVLAGRVAVSVSGARKGVKRIGRFWDHLVWSRLVNWGRDFFGVREQLVVLTSGHVIHPESTARGATDVQLPDISLQTNTRSRAHRPR